MYKPENRPLMVRNERCYNLRTKGMRWADIALELNLPTAQHASGLAKNYSAREGLPWPIEIKR